MHQRGILLAPPPWKHGRLSPFARCGLLTLLFSSIVVFLWVSRYWYRYTALGNTSLLNVLMTSGIV